MALMNEHGESISYECGILIEQLKEDIEENTGARLVWVRQESRHGVSICTDYSLSKKDGYDTQMSMTALLVRLEQQNSVI